MSIAYKVWSFIEPDNKEGATMYYIYYIFAIVFSFGMQKIEFLFLEVIISLIFYSIKGEVIGIILDLNIYF